MLKKEKLMNYTETALIKDTIESVHRYRDHAMWEKIEDQFTQAPFVDDKALTSDQPGVKKAVDIISGWKGELRNYFYATRHRIRSTRVSLKNAKEASAVSPILGQYFITDRGERYVLSIEGTYNYDLVKRAGKWKIGSLSFKLKNQSLRPIGA
jgi:hypothetical protein